MWYSLFKHTRCYHNSQFVLLSITLHILWILLYYIVTFNRKSDLFKLYFFTYNLKSFYYWCGTVLSVSTNFFYLSSIQAPSCDDSSFVFHPSWKVFLAGNVMSYHPYTGFEMLPFPLDSPFLFFHESDSYFHPSSE